MSNVSRVFKGGIAAIAGAALYWAGLYSAQKRLVFNPVDDPHPTDVPPSACSPTSERCFELKSVAAIARDNTILRGLALINRTPGPRPILVYLGGRGEDIRWLRFAEPLIRECHLYSLNYRGFGLSQGHASEKQVVQDAIDFIEALAKDNPGNPIYLLGRSLGTGVAVQAALACPVLVGMTLITPYDSLVEIAKMRFPLAPVSHLLNQRFDSAYHVQKLKLPCQIALAEHDDIVPHTRSQALIRKFATAPESRIIVQCDHGSIVYQEVLWSGIERHALQCADNALRN